MSYDIYSRAGCDWCDKAKELLISRDIPFVEYVVGEAVTRHELEVWFPDARFLPIILHDGQMIGGYLELVDHLDQMEKSHA